MLNKQNLFLGILKRFIMLGMFWNKPLLCFIFCGLGSLSLSAQGEKDIGVFSIAVGANTSSYITITDNNAAPNTSIDPVFLGGNLSMSYQPNTNRMLNYFFEARYSYLGFQSDRYIPTHAVITTPQSPVFRDVYSSHQVGVGAGFSYNAFSNKKFSIICKGSMLVAFALKNDIIQKTYTPGSSDVFFIIKDINASEDAKDFNLFLSTRFHFDHFRFLRNRITPYLGISYHVLNYTTSEFINGGFANSGIQLDGKLIAFSLGVSYRMN